MTMKRTAAALGLVVAVGAVAAIMLWPRPRALPEPLFRDDALPTIPPANQNGWYALSVGVVDDIDLDSDVGSSLQRVADEELSARERFEGLLEVEAQRRATLKDAAHVRALEQWDAAARRPTFADACTVDTVDECQYFGWWKASQLGLTRAVSRALDEGDTSGSFEALADTLAVVRGMLTTSRTVMAATVGLEASMQTLAVTQLLLARSGPLDGAGEAARGRVIDEIEALESSKVLEGSELARRAQAGEYLLARHGLDQIAQGSASLDEALLLDVERTAILLDQASKYAGGDADSPPSCTAFESIRNRYGCQLFAGEAYAEVNRSAQERIERDRETALRWLQRVQQTLESR
jgi:hypothetical protein